MIFEQLRHLIADALQMAPEDIAEDMSFRDDLGADSLEVYQIVMAAEQAFDVELENKMSDALVQTVGELRERIAAARNT